MALHNRKKMTAAACRYAYHRLALNFYMYYEIWCGQTQEDAWMEQMNQELFQAMRRFLKGEYGLEELKKLRAQATARMEELTSYTDSFQVYEYVLNRQEGKFVPEALTLYEETDEQRLQWLMGYIRGGKDALEVNRRIQMIMGQLPVRLTRNKFYALMLRGMESYKGAPLERLKRVKEALEGEAMLRLPQSPGHFPQLFALQEKFQSSDYRHLTGERYQELTEDLAEIGRQLTDLSSQTVLFMELVNDLYALCLTRQNTLMEAGEEAQVKAVLSMVLDRFADGHGYGMGDQEADMLRPLEGRQEKYLAQWEAFAVSEDVLEKEAAESPEAEILRQLSLLLSSSDFMSLEPEKESKAVADQEQIEQWNQELSGQLEKLFSQLARPVVRAVMAKILSALPVFFASMDEAGQYLSGCLASCTDEAEKAMSMKLIRQLAQEEAAI